ncbi:hypothetical protein LB579_33425, partial [Mesorhizobium sp. BR1-1-7]
MRTNSLRLSRIALACAASAFTAFGPATAGAADLSSILFVNPLPKYPAWRLIGDCVADRAKELNIPATESGPTTGNLDATIMIQ